MASTLSRKINVLEMNSSLGLGGGQRNMLTFAKYFSRDIFNIFVATYSKGGPREQELTAMGLVYLIGDGTSEKIIDYIKQNAIDIIHIHRSGGVAPLETEIIRGARYVNPNIIIVEKNVFGKYDPSMDAMIDCLFFQSMMQLNERYLVASGNAFNFARHKILYNMVEGIVFEKFRLTYEGVLSYKTTLGIQPGDFVIGKIGRSDLAKWSDLAFDMMPYLIRLVPSVKFLIIGLPPSRLARIRRSRFAKSIIVLPETSDERELANFYQTIDVLAHSSKIGECNGNTINEAMFWGKPVVVNSTPKKDNGQLEQVEHLVTGIIANHPATYARAIAFLMAHPGKRREMGDRAHERIISQNNPTVITRQVEKLFIEKLADKGFFSDLAEAREYATISYYPSIEDIANYRAEYQRRLACEFGAVSLAERTIEWMHQPYKFFTKLKDFIEHRYGK